MPNIIPLTNYNLGGISDSRWSGKKDSYFKLVGLDLHSQPGLVNVAQKMTKNSAAVVTEFCKVAIVSSNGSTYWGSSTSGKVWERTSGGTWRLVHTLTPAAGTAYVLGMAEYQGYIYIATQSRLHRITVAKADDNDWATDLTEDWATFTITDTAFHPMHVNTSGSILYIGDGNYLAQVDANTFTADALDIKTPLRIKSLGQIGNDELIGTYVSDYFTKTALIRWNTWSALYTTADEISETGINAFLPMDNVVLFQAGLAGNIYSYNGSYPELYKKIPGTYSDTAYGQVNPYSVANLNGKVLFGFSNGSGNPADQGIYQLARADRKYPPIMDMPYPISERSGDDLVTSGLEIGAVVVSGFNVFVAWKNSTAYGVDMLDYSNKLSGAYIETRITNIERDKFSTVNKIVFSYYSIPTGCSIAISYDKNYDGYVAMTVVKDTDRKIVSSEEGIESTLLSVKTTFTASGNTAPSIESGAIYLS